MILKITPKNYFSVGDTFYTAVFDMCSLLVIVLINMSYLKRKMFSSSLLPCGILITLMFFWWKTSGSGGEVPCCFSITHLYYDLLGIQLCA